MFTIRKEPEVIQKQYLKMTHTYDLSVANISIGARTKDKEGREINRSLVSESCFIYFFSLLSISLWLIRELTMSTTVFP